MLSTTSAEEASLSATVSTPALPASLGRHLRSSVMVSSVIVSVLGKLANSN